MEQVGTRMYGWFVFFIVLMVWVIRGNGLAQRIMAIIVVIVILVIVIILPCPAC